MRLAGVAILVAGLCLVGYGWYDGRSSDDPAWIEELMFLVIFFDSMPMKIGVAVALCGLVMSVMPRQRE